MKKILLLSLLILISKETICFAQYKLESSTKINASSPDWDYIALDSASEKLFIAMRGNGVVVFDTKTNNTIQTISQSEDANSVLIIKEKNKGYTFNADGSVTIFLLDDLKTIKRVSIGNNADSGFYDPISDQIMITMGDSQIAKFINANTAEITGTVSVESHKLDGSVSDEMGNFYVALRDKNMIIKIDSKRKVITGKWKTNKCREPTSLAINQTQKKIYIGCRGKDPILAVMSYLTGKIEQQVEIGRGVDGIVYDEKNKVVMTANGIDSNLVMYEVNDRNELELKEVITTRPNARTMAYDAKKEKIYLVTAEGFINKNKKISKKIAPFYPNQFYDNTFTVLTYSNNK